MAAGPQAVLLLSRKAAQSSNCPAVGLYQSWDRIHMKPCLDISERICFPATSLQASSWLGRVASKQTQRWSHLSSASQSLKRPGRFWSTSQKENTAKRIKGICGHAAFSSQNLFASSVQFTSPMGTSKPWQMTSVTPSASPPSHALLTRPALPLQARTLWKLSSRHNPSFCTWLL